MSLIKIKNIEVLSGNKIKIVYDQPVKVNANYNLITNYTFIPPLTVSSIESTVLSAIDYSIVNLTHHMLDLQRYDVTVKNIINLADEPLDPDYNSYDFIGDATKPYVVSATALDEDTVRITFDRIMDSASATNADNYSITSDYTGHRVLIDSIAYNSTYVDITINQPVSPMTDGFNHSVYIKNIKDYNGNLITSGSKVSFDGIATTLTKLLSVQFDTSQRPEQLFLVFDREIDESSVLTYGSFEINPDAAGIQAYYNKVRVSGKNKKITVDITETTGGSTYTLLCGDSIRDIFGNTIDPGNKSGTFSGYGHNPSISYIEFVSKNIVNVYFDEPVRDNYAARNTANYSMTGSITIHKVAAVSNNKICLIVSPLTESASYTLSVTSASITDAAGNALNLPANATATTPESFEDNFASNIDLYEFVPISYRDMDDSTLLKRYIGAMQLIIDDLFEKARNLRYVPLLDTIKDEHLYYVRSNFGWRGYESILNRLSYDEIRKLYANSISLFKRRGAGGSVGEALNLIFDVTSYEVNHFDDKFLLDNSYLMMHKLGEDAPALDIEGIHTTYLKIVDPDDELDHEAVEELIKIWNPSIERFFVQYLLCYENFDANFSKDNYTYRLLVGDTENTSYTVSNNKLDMNNDAEFEIFYVDTKQSYKFENICFYATVMPKSTISGGTFGLTCGYTYGGSDEYRFDINPVTNQLKVIKSAVTLTTLDLSTKNIYIEDDRVLNIKIDFEHISGTDYYNVYIDGNIVLSSSNVATSNPGTFGVYHVVDTQLEVYLMQCSELPANNVIIDLN